MRSIRPFALRVLIITVEIHVEAAVRILGHGTGIHQQRPHASLNAVIYGICTFYMIDHKEFIRSYFINGLSAVYDIGFLDRLDRRPLHAGDRIVHIDVGSRRFLLRYGFRRFVHCDRCDLAG